MSIPKEPRQLMINIMYLVLTALLALNVSAEIFNAFKMVDKGLNSANDSLDEKNAALPAVIQERAKKNEAFEKYSNRVDSVQALSEEASAYIDEIVLYLVDQAGDKDGAYSDGDYVIDANGNKEIKGLKNYDATTHWLVDGGKGMEIKDKMMEYKGRFLQFIDAEEQEGYASKIPIEIDNEAWKTSLTKRENWADFTFNHMPVGACMPIFTKFKNDIKSSESSILNYLMGKVGGEEVVLDQFKVVSSPKKTYVMEGESFETEIFLSASASKGNNTGLEIRVGGSNLRIDEDGVAKYTARAGAVGKKTYKAVINVTNPVSGEVKPYESSFEYEVGRRSVAISPTKMNVFYIGVDNPVEISAAGVSSNKMNVSMAGGGGTIKATGDGANYIVNVSKPTPKGVFAKISVSADGMNASKDFRVKRIPDPVARLSKKSSGAMPSGEFKVQSGVRAALDNFDFDARCNISGYRLVRVAPRQDPEFATNKGGKYGGEAARLVAKASPGDRYFYENVKCKCPGDVAQRQINAMTFSIR